MLVENLFTHPIFFLRIIAILIISICLHELGHGLAAISQGDDTPIARGHMTLNPVVHMGVPSLIFLVITGMAWGQMPVNPRKFRHSKWSNVLVSGAGPLTNFILGLIAILIIHLARGSFLADFVSLQFFFYIAYLNFALGMFNLCPIPPLDGFQVASEFFPEIKPWANSQVGLALFMILFISGAGRVFFQLSQMLVVFFLDLNLG